MNKSANTGLIIGGSVIAGGGYFGYQAYQDAQPVDSPVADESNAEKTDSVRAAFGDPDAVADTEIQAFVDRLMTAVVQGDKTAVQGLVSTTRLVDAVEAGMDEKLPDFARSMLEKQLGPEMAEYFDQTAVITQVRHIDRDSEGNIVVYLRQIDRDRIQVKMRWWLVPDGDGLKWWDGEDLQLGLRLSAMMSAGVTSAQNGNEAKLQNFITVLSELATLSFDDEAQVRAFGARLDALDTTGLPPSFRNLALVSQATISTSLGRPQEALDRLDTLEEQSLDPIELPVRHFQRGLASMSLEQWDASAAALQRYLDLLGDDAETYALLGLVHRQNGDDDKALAAFDAGIDDDPGLGDNYAGVAATVDSADALAKRLAKVTDLAVFDTIVPELLEYEDDEATQRLVDAAAKTHPDWKFPDLGE